MATSSKPKILKIAIVGIFPLLCVIIGFMHVPQPVSAEKERKSFSRKKIEKELLSKTPSLNAPAENILLGKQIRFLGANLPQNVLSPGQNINLDFFFEVLNSLDRNWKFFVHIDPKTQGRRIHGDHMPVKGKYNTSLWQKGEILKDNHSQRIPETASPGVYTVWLGLYIGDERLAITSGEKPNHDGNDRIRVGSITVGRK